MMKKIVSVEALALALMFAGTSKPAWSQEAGSSKAAPEADKAPHAYRLDFSVDEMEGGMKINMRQYSMNLNSGHENQIKIGTRVQVGTKQADFQYLDVGTNIWCRLRDRSDIASLGNDVLVQVRTDISNFAIPDQQQEQQQGRPVLRQFSINASTLALVGKPTVMGSVDDPNSKRQFQLDITVTKLR